MTCRDLDGYFEHVWTVHPFATLVTSEDWMIKYGRPQTFNVNPRHTFIEGKVGRLEILKHIRIINFILSQIDIYIFLKNLIKIEQITVIRVGDPLYLGLFGWALSLSCRIPFVIRVGGNHDKIYETTGRPIEKNMFVFRYIEKLVERFTFKRADLVAGANQDNLNFALANGASVEYSTLFRYGNLIDYRHFVEPTERIGGIEILSELGIENGSFILYIGRLEQVKHPDTVVRVFAEIKKRGYVLKALMAGDGKLKSNILELASELGVADQVVLCGNRDQDWLSKVIPFAKAVLSPHTGRALSEVALGAAPIVAYDVDWQGELIRTGITGELVPHLDWMKMADALERFLKNPAYAHAMGRAVRQYTLELMDPEKLNQHERDQYSMLLSRYKKT